MEALEAEMQKVINVMQQEWDEEAEGESVEVHEGKNTNASTNTNIDNSFER
jgi:hypothetical protein